MGLIEPEKTRETSARKWSLASDDARDVVAYWEKLAQGWDCVFGSRYFFIVMYKYLSRSNYKRPVKTETARYEHPSIP